jgi:hypothetical protein
VGLGLGLVLGGLLSCVDKRGIPNLGVCDEWTRAPQARPNASFERRTSLARVEDW